MKHYSVAITQTESLIFLVDAENEEEAKKVALEDYENGASDPFDAFVENAEVTEIQECADMEYNEGEEFIKVRVHPKLKKELRILCAKKNRSMQDFINESLRNELRK